MLGQAVLLPEPSAHVAGSTDLVDVSQMSVNVVGQEPMSARGQVPCVSDVRDQQSVALASQHLVAIDGQEPSESFVAKVGQEPLANGTMLVGHEPSGYTGIGQELFTEVLVGRTEQNTEAVSTAASPRDDSLLNALAADFLPRVKVQQFVLGTGTGAGDLRHVQEVQAGGVGQHTPGVSDLWNKGDVRNGCCDEMVIKNMLPFHGESELPDMLGVAPKQIHKISMFLFLMSFSRIMFSLYLEFGFPLDSQQNQS